MQYVVIGDTVYFYAGVNASTGSGADGSAPAFAVRLAGASSSAAPTLTGTPTLLSNAGYPDGCYEVAVAATLGNGFAANAVYAVFFTLTVSALTPTAYLGSFRTGGVAITDDKITLPAEAAGRPTAALAMLRRLFESSPWGNKRTRVRSTGVAALRNAADGADLASVTQSTSVVSPTDSQTQGA